MMSLEFPPYDVLGVPQIIEFAAFFANLTLDEAMARFEPADCCFAPALTLDQADETEQTRAHRLARRGEDGRCQALFPGKVDGEALAVRRGWREI